MEPIIALKTAIRARLIVTNAVTSLVPENAILDKNARPVPEPASIIIGEGQTVPDDGLARNRHQTFMDLHIWKTEPSLTGCQTIAGVIRAALADSYWNISGLHVADMLIQSTRFMRDPDGKHSHGIMSIQARVMEVA